MPARPVVEPVIHLYCTSSLNPQIQALMQNIRTFYLMGHDGKKWSLVTNMDAKNVASIYECFVQSLKDRGFSVKEIEIGDEKVAKLVADVIKRETGLS